MAISHRTLLAVAGSSPSDFPLEWVKHIAVFNGLKMMRELATSITTVFIFASSAFAQVPNTLLQTIAAPPTGVQSGAQLGYSVAMDGGYAVAGAPFDDTGGTDAGVAKVFDSTTGALLFVLSNPSPAVNDQFGFSVAISGTLVVVGAPLDDTGATDSGSAYVYNLSSATPTVPVVTLNNPGPAASDSFGYSVAISGTRVVVGAYQDDTGATDSGSAYVYDLSTGTPTVPVATLNNPGPAVGDQFGISVAISGVRVVVGAALDDTGVTNAGSAYVYDISSGTPTVPVTTLNNPSPTGADFFGTSVAISGTRVVVGVYQDDTGATNAGSAYVYDVSSGTPTVPVATLNNPTPFAGDYFGWTVGISGTRVVVGAYFNDTAITDDGSAYVYDLSSGTPTVPVATLNNPGPGPATGDYFGYAVSISGARVVVGTPRDDIVTPNTGSGYVYDLNSGTPTMPVVVLNNPGPGPGDDFGCSVAISGPRVVVGAYLDVTSPGSGGSAYVYDMSSAMPAVSMFTLSNPSVTSGSDFGYSVAISGTWVVVGANKDDTGAIDAGSAYIYDLSSATPTVPVFTLNNPGPAVNDQFGCSVAISGTRVVVGTFLDDTGAADAGSAYVYDLSSGTPTVPVFTLTNPSPAASDSFGYSVAISGGRLVIGAHLDNQGATDAGSAYVYDLSSGTPTVPVFTLNNPSPAVSDQFGVSVAISGTRAVVGANLDDAALSDAGTAYVYDLSSGTPTVPVFTLNHPGPATGDRFGVSVSISGTRVLVGAHLRDTGATDAGSVYVYDLSSGTPTVPQATLNNPAPGPNDQFGFAVAIDGAIAAIGAPLDDTVMLDKGAAYVFDPGVRATTSAATGLTTTGAILNGTVNPNGVTTTAQFHYGLTTAYGSTAGVTLSPNNGTSPQTVSAAISGLTSGSTYHFRMTASFTGGTNYGADMTFTTLAGDIAVEQPFGTNISDGASAPSFGGLLFGTSGPPKTFTIRNVGNANLTGLVVTKDGTYASDYTVSTIGTATTLLPGGSTTFAVTFSPAGTVSGTRAAAIHIASNDPDENPFDIALTGQGFSATADIDADGLNDWAEFQMAVQGFDWQVNQTALVNNLYSSANTAGLYTPSQVQALNVGIPLLQRHPSTGVFTLTIGIEKSTDLSIFNPFPMTAPQMLINGQGKLEFQFTVPDNAAFFQLRAQ